MSNSHRETAAPAGAPRLRGALHGMSPQRGAASGRRWWWAELIGLDVHAVSAPTRRGVKLVDTQFQRAGLVGDEAHVRAALHELRAHAQNERELAHIGK